MTNASTITSYYMKGVEMELDEDVVYRIIRLGIFWMSQKTTTRFL